MEGIPTWPQFIWLATLVFGAVAAGFLAAWRVMEMRKADRHELRSFYEQRFTVLDEKHTDALAVQKTTHDLELKALAARLDTVEDFRAGTLITLQHLDEFRKDVAKRFDVLAEHREKDIRGINSRLDVILNSTALVGRQPDGH